jgi:hypothetical protein
MANDRARGVYCLANDHVLHWFAAFARSLRVHNPDMPVWLIPFDSMVSEVLKLCEKHCFNVVRDPSLEVLDGLGRMLYPNSHVAQHAFRKFLMFWGPLREYLFLDSDIVVLEPLDALFEMLESSNAQLIYWDQDHEQVYRKGSFRDHMIQRYDSKGINTGALLARRDVLTLEQVENAGRNVLWHRDQFANTLEQPFFNYCLDRGHARMTYIGDVVNKTVKVWAGAPGLGIPRGPTRSATESETQVASWTPFIHWAGYKLHWNIPYRTLFQCYGTIPHRTWLGPWLWLSLANTLMGLLRPK